MEGNRLINNASLWQSNEQWNLTEAANGFIYIRNIKNGKVLGIDNNKVIEQDFLEGKLGQLWIGPSHYNSSSLYEGSFTLQNAESLSMVLTTSKSNFELKGIWLMKYGYFIDCFDSKLTGKWPF